MGIGNLGRILHFFQRGVLHAEGDIVPDGVVEQDGFLVHVADKLAQVVHAQVFHVDAVDEHLALLHVVVARYQVNQCGLSRARLSHDGNGLALLDDEVYIAQHPLFAVAERHIAELYLVLERLDILRVLGFLDVVLGHQYLVHALHRGQSRRDVVAGLREFLQRVDDAVENHQVIDERTARDGGVVQHLHAAEPQHDDNHHRAQELAHGVRQLLARVHPEYVVAVFLVHLSELCVHLVLGVECLDDAQSAQRLLHHAHRIAPKRLRLHRVLLQAAAHIAHEPTEQRHEYDGEKRKLPRNEQQR